MSGLNDVNITIADGALGRRNPSQDMVSGLITTGVATGSLALATSVELKSLADLEAYEIDAAYDTTNNVLVHHHVKEFFRMNPSGTLWLRLQAQTEALTDLADIANGTFAAALLNDAQGAIRQLAIGHNPSVGYTPTTTNGIDEDVLTAIPKAQELAATFFAAKMPVIVILEGRSFTGTATAAADLRALNAPNVGVTILQDDTVADGHAILNGYAAIGTTLGAMSRASVNVSIAYVEGFNLQSVADSMYLNDAQNNNLNISSKLPISSYSQTDQGTLQDKGYLFARRFQGVAGAYFAESSACVAFSSDFAYLENSRTMLKASRLIYAAFVPKLNSPVEVDASTGQLEPATVKFFEGLGLQALRVMEQGSEVSAVDVTVDPSQNIIATSTLEVRFSITPTGSAKKINATVAFNNPFNS